MANVVQIIMPSTVAADRRNLIFRALESVRHQRGVKVSILLVANGPNVDESLLSELQKRDGVVVIREAIGSAPRAQRIGRDAVTAPYFGFLDDDDELLQGALKLRVAAFDKDPETDIVVTNGYRNAGGINQLMFEEFVAEENCPLRALVRRNWLSSCGALYRTASVSANFWDSELTYMEWTALAFKVAHAKLNIRFLNELTFIVHDTEESLSKSVDFVTGAPSVLEKLLQSEIGQETRLQFFDKLARMHNDAAYASLQAGNVGEAWKHHRKSLGTMSGFLRHWRFAFQILRKSLFGG